MLPLPSPLGTALLLGLACLGPRLEAQRELPALDHEPLLEVLIARGERVAVHLEQPALLQTPGGTLKLNPGTHLARAKQGRWSLSGSRAHAGAGLVRSGGQPIFRVQATPLFGEPPELVLAGDLILRAEEDEVLVVERLPMETYLAAVVSAEMNPSWPAEALAAQAIVARSYAAARWMDRHDQPWHLHWHFGVDMAYPGWKKEHARVARTIAKTRGQVLMHRGFPVLALFNASSGGRTEAFDRVKPGVLAPDGKTPIAAAMPVVDDAAALAGARALSLADSHGSWKADIPLPELTRALQAWSKEGQGRPELGTIEAVSVLERHPDSRRVARISLRHRLNGRERFQSMLATDFRLAVSPVRIRSLYWDRCVIASRSPGYLVLQGRGFGHGCGLSQVSAWYLAKRGESAAAIVQRFYRGSRIERRYR